VLVHEQLVKVHTRRDEQEVRCHQQLISAGDDDFSAELLTALVLIKNTFYIAEVLDVVTSHNHCLL
jgi:hypothetical protein